MVLLLLAEQKQGTRQTSKEENRLAKGSKKIGKRELNACGNHHAPCVLDGPALGLFHRPFQLRALCTHPLEFHQPPLELSADFNESADQSYDSQRLRRYSLIKSSPISLAK